MENDSPVSMISASSMETFFGCFNLERDLFRFYQNLVEGKQGQDISILENGFRVSG